MTCKDFTTPPPLIKAFASPNRTPRAKDSPVRLIVMHYTAAHSVQSTLSWFMNPVSKRSAHFVVDKTGDIYQCVGEGDVAYHCKGFNHNSIGIEHVSMGESLTPKQAVATTYLISHLLEKYSLPHTCLTGHRFLGRPTDCPAQIIGDGSEEAFKKWRHETFAFLFP